MYNKQHKGFSVTYCGFAYVLWTFAGEAKKM